MFQYVLDHFLWGARKAPSTGPNLQLKQWSKNLEKQLKINENPVKTMKVMISRGLGEVYSCQGSAALFFKNPLQQ